MARRTDTLVARSDRNELPWRQVVSTRATNRNSINGVGVRRRGLCEICKAPGGIACQRCEAVFYCSAEHRDFDDVAIHRLVCADLASIRSTEALMSQLAREAMEDLRQKKKLRKCAWHTQLALLEKCQDASRQYLLGGQYDKVIPCGLLCVKLIRDVHGPYHERVLEPYITMAQSSLGMGDVRLAKQFFVLARLVYQRKRSAHTDLLVRSRFLRTWARIALHDVDASDDSTYMAAKDVYYWTMEFGLHHAKTASGYFLVALNFLRADDRVRGKATLAHAVRIVRDSLAELLESVVDVLESLWTLDDCDAMEEALLDRGGAFLDLEEREELLLILHTAIYCYGKNGERQHPDLFPTVFYGLAYLNCLCMRLRPGLVYFAKALETNSERASDANVELYNRIERAYTALRLREQSQADSDEDFQMGSEYLDDNFLPMRRSLWPLLTTDEERVLANARNDSLYDDDKATTSEVPPTAETNRDATPDDAPAKKESEPEPPAADEGAPESGGQSEIDDPLDDDGGGDLAASESVGSGVGSHVDDILFDEVPSAQRHEGDDLPASSDTTSSVPIRRPTLTIVRPTPVEGGEDDEASADPEEDADES